MAWTEESKALAIAAYKALNPTPLTTAECLKEVAEELEQSANGVRMILVKAGVYVAQGTAKATASTGAKPTGVTKVSKAQSAADLSAVLTDLGQEPDMEIIEKLTGKAAIYFTEILRKLEQSIEA
jgi:hypothetical protein